MNIVDLVNTQNSMLLFLSLGAALFLYVNVRMMRDCYYDIRGGMYYFVGNYAAYLIFMAVSLLLYFFGGSGIFTWLFAITKFVRYTGGGVSNLVSTLIFHAVMLLSVLLAPLGMKQQILMYEDEE